MPEEKTKKGDSAIAASAVVSTGGEGDCPTAAKVVSGSQIPTLKIQSSRDICTSSGSTVDQPVKTTSPATYPRNNALRWMLGSSGSLNQTGLIDNSWYPVQQANYQSYSITSGKSGNQRILYTPIEVQGGVDQMPAISYQATGGYTNQYLSQGGSYSLMGQMFANNQYNTQIHMHRGLYQAAQNRLVFPYSAQAYHHYQVMPATTATNRVASSPASNKHTQLKVSYRSYDFSGHSPPLSSKICLPQSSLSPTPYSPKPLSNNGSPTPNWETRKSKINSSPISGKPSTSHHIHGGHTKSSSYSPNQWHPYLDHSCCTHSKGPTSVSAGLYGYNNSIPSYNFQETQAKQREDYARRLYSLRYALKSDVFMGYGKNTERFELYTDERAVSPLKLLEIDDSLDWSADRIESTTEFLDKRLSDEYDDYSEVFEEIQAMSQALTR